MKAPSWLSKLNPFAGAERRDVYIALALAVVTIILYAPGMDWGLPDADEPFRTRPWAPDELGPIGPIVELRNTMGGANLGNPQYPLFHYVVIFIFYVPYLALKMLTGGLTNPQGGFPFGFADPASSVKHLLLIARSVSVLTGAGTVIAVFAIGKTLWDRATGALAAVILMLAYPMFYYGKISNVDVPALFWSALVLLLYVRVIQGGFTLRRAICLGVFAALAVATKDGSYGIFLLLPLVMLRTHWQRLAAENQNTLAKRWGAPLMGLAVSALLYMFASGFALRPEKYFQHLAYIRGGSGSGRFYFQYAASLEGYWGLMRESLHHLTDSMGWPLLLLAAVGVVFALWRERLKATLLLVIPALFVLVFMPVRYVELRYVMPWALVLALFAASGAMLLWRSRNVALRGASALLVVGGCALCLAQGVELAYVMHKDSRYDFPKWMAQYSRSGETLEVFGSARERLRFIPRMPAGLQARTAEVTRQPGDGKLQGEFIALWGRDDLDDFWHCPRWTYDGLMDGSLGYELVADLKTPSIFSLHTKQIFINPRILIFARHARAAEIRRGVAASHSATPSTP